MDGQKWLLAAPSAEEFAASALEEQYGLLSADFYLFYRAGELEQTRDFIRRRDSTRRNRNVKHFREFISPESVVDVGRRVCVIHVLVCR